MGTRFIHKNGRVIPVHSDHGDQPQSSGQHAAPQTAPNTPAPVAGKEGHNHPAPVKAPVKENHPFAVTHPDDQAALDAKPGEDPDKSGRTDKYVAKADKYWAKRGITNPPWSKR